MSESPGPEGGADRLPARVVVLVPVYNDWRAAQLLLRRIAEELVPLGVMPEVVFIDDASVEKVPAVWEPPVEAVPVRVEVLHLRRNLGHQRALAVGMAHAADERQADAVVLMDGDGEDAPEAIPRLLKAMLAEGGRKVIFAERQQRAERWFFRVCYWCYRQLHRLLTGERIRFGNFSVIPWPVLKRVVSVSEIWNHYAAALVRARVPFALVPTDRARRLTGESKMSFIGLVIHGLSAISVFGEVIGVKLLIGSVLSFGMLALGLVGLVVYRMIQDQAVLSWALLLGALLVAGFIQIVALCLQFAFLVLQARSNASFLPSRDYIYYVEGCERLL